MNVTIGCVVLEYDELPEKTKEKLLRDTFQSAAEIYRADHIEDEFRIKLEEIGFMEPDFWWSINGGQGDGACFDAKPDMVKICKHLGIAYNPKTLDDEWACEIEIDQFRAVHKRSRSISCSLSYDAPPEIDGQIEDLRLGLCDEFYRALVADYESETGQENLLEILRSRRYAIRSDIESTLAEASQSEDVVII